MKEHKGVIRDGFHVFGAEHGDFLFTIPEEERGTAGQSDHVVVGDTIRIDYRPGFLAFEKVRP